MPLSVRAQPMSGSVVGLSVPLDCGPVPGRLACSNSHESCDGSGPFVRDADPSHSFREAS